MIVNHSNDGLNIISRDLNEELFLSELMDVNRITEHDISWHHLIKTKDSLNQLTLVQELYNWGIEPEEEDLRYVQRVLSAKRKKYMLDIMPLVEVRNTPQFKRALSLVESRFGEMLPDGSHLFDYQKEAAAFVIAKKRMLLALDTGLGKTRTAIVSSQADPSNQRSLFITMSRNLNDWVREIKHLGLGDDYILLKDPEDLHSDKKIHLVSYEKWSRDSITFRKKLHEACPSCGTSRPAVWKKHLGYCKACQTTHTKYQTNLDGEVLRWSDDDLPEKCPDCGAPWKQHSYHCECGYTVIESRRPPLYTYMHNGYDFTSVDEIHYIKNGQSKRSQSVRACRTEKRIGLSGTPAENSTEDLYWILGWLTGFTSRYEDPITRTPFRPYGNGGLEHFREHFAGGAKIRVLDIDSIKPRSSNHEELWRVLDSIMYRKRKTDPDVEKETNIPKPEHHRVHLELLPEERKTYDLLLQEFRQWYDLELMKKEAAEQRGEKYRINMIEICAFMDKLRKAASCPWVFDHYFDSTAARGTTAKLEMLRTIVTERLQKGEKVLVFSGHKETVEHLGMILNGLVPGKEVGYIHGSVPKEARWDMMERFQDPNDPMSVIVFSHRTGAESYTLTEAKAVVLYDLDFNGKKLEQCIARAVRYGQKDIVDVYWLLGINTIDVNMHGLVLSKIAGVDKSIDREEFDFKQVAKEFEGDGVMLTGINYEEFAAQMLASGTKRDELVN